MCFYIFLLKWIKNLNIKTNEIKNLGFVLQILAHFSWNNSNRTQSKENVAKFKKIKMPYYYMLMLDLVSCEMD